MHLRFIAGQKTLGFERMGVGPVGPVPLQGPGRNHHQGAALEPARSHLTIAQCHARHKGDRRVQAQGFAEYGFEQRQAFQVFETEFGGADNPLDFSAHPRHQSRPRRADIEQPGQRARGGLVTGEEEHAQLVDQLVAGERLPRVPIPRGDHRAGDVVVLGVWRQMGVDQGRQVGAYPAAGRKHRRRLRRMAPGGLQDQVFDIDLGHRALKDREVFEHLGGNARVQGGREHGAADDVGREVAHGLVQGQRFAFARRFVEHVQIIAHRRLHGAEGVADPQLRKRRVDHGPLAAPARAVGDKDRGADKRLQRAHHQVAFGEVLVRVAHNLPHQLRCVEQHRGASRVAQIAHLETVGGRRQQFQQIAVAVPEHSGQGRQGRQRVRSGRFVTRCCAHRLTVSCILNTILNEYPGEGP